MRLLAGRLAAGRPQINSEGECSMLERDAKVWQARTQVGLAVVIERYLKENPAPPTATDPLLYRRWAAELRAAGEADLEALGELRLRAA